MFNASEIFNQMKTELGDSAPSFTIVKSRFLNLYAAMQPNRNSQ